MFNENWCFLHFQEFLNLSFCICICHQRQDEILIIFTRIILDSAKLFFCRKVRISNNHSCVKRAYLQQARKRVPCELDCVNCRGHRYCMAIFWKQLLDEVRVKRILISSSCWWRFLTATSAIQMINIYRYSLKMTFHMHFFDLSCAYVHTGTCIHPSLGPKFSSHISYQFLQ